MLTIIAGIGTVIYLKSRTAILSIILTLIIWKITQIKICKRTLLLSSVLLTIILGLAILGYYIKPLSFHGRLLGWFVALDIIMESPFRGIGTGNVANWLNHFQANYLAHSSSVPLKISAYSNRQLFNWYFEYAVENGLIMSIPFFSFLYYSIKKSLQVLKLKVGVSDNNLMFIKGFALAVIGFLIMCLTHYPHKVIPIFMLFNICLALVASYPLNGKKEQNNVIPKTVIFTLILIIISFIGIKLPYYYKNFIAAIEWRQAVNLSIEDDHVAAQMKYEKVYSQLEWNHRFLYHYGNNQLVLNKYDKAINLFQRAAELYPDPFMYEKLGVAYSHIYLDNPLYIEYKKQAIKLLDACK